MYKSSYANGDKWYEFIKLAPACYATLAINGDGSHTSLDQYSTKSLAKKYVQYMNDNFATEGGKLKMFKMSEGKEFLSTKTYNLLNRDAEGFPLCPIYKEVVLPDENDLCSLCATHSASVTVGTEWATLAQLKITSNLPF